MEVPFAFILPHVGGHKIPHAVYNYPMRFRARLFVLLFFSAILYAQTVTVTGQPLSANDLKAMFGGLPKGYSGIQVEVCSTDSKAITVPLGMIRQQLRSALVTVLSNQVAQAVIAHAQGSTKKALVGRVTIAAIESAAVAASFSGISPAWKTGLTDTAIDGAALWTIISGTTTVNPLLAYQPLPETLMFLPGPSCIGPAVQLVEGIVPPNFSMPVTLPKSAAAIASSGTIQ